MDVMVKLIKLEVFDNIKEVISIAIKNRNEWIECLTYIDDREDSVSISIASALANWSLDYQFEVDYDEEWCDCECCGSYVDKYWTITREGYEYFIEIKEDGHFGNGYGWCQEDIEEDWKGFGVNVFFENF